MRIAKGVLEQLRLVFERRVRSADAYTEAAGGATHLSRWLDPFVPPDQTMKVTTKLHLFIKIPGSGEGLPVVEEAIFAGDGSA